MLVLAHTVIRRLVRSYLATAPAVSRGTAATRGQRSRRRTTRSARAKSPVTLPKVRGRANTRFVPRVSWTSGPPDPRVGVRRPEDSRVQHSGFVDIVEVAGFAAQELRIFEPLDALPDPPAHRRVCHHARPAFSTALTIFW